MPVRNLVLALLISLLPVAGVGPALAGQGWELEYVGRDQGQEGVVVVQVDDQHLRIAPQGEDAEVILGPEAVLLIDHDGRTWSTFTYAEAEGMLRGFTAMMDGMMEEMKKNMTPEQIEAMESEMGGMSDGEDPGRIEFRPASGSESVAGVKASVSEVYKDGELQGRMWTTDEIPVTLVNDLLHRIQTVVPEQFRKQMKEMDGLQRLPGFPLRMVDETRGGEEVVVARRADRKTLGAEVFSPPRGYTETESPLRKMGQGFGGLGRSHE